MNNLDPEVAERPDELVVYGGRGKAARSWEAFDANVMDARSVAVEGYRGMLGGRAIVIPGFRNRLLASGYRFAPRGLITKVVRGIQERRNH